MKPEFLWIKAKIECEQYSDSKYIENHLHNSDMQDEDGYPTDVALEVIERWGWDNKLDLFKFISSLWYFHNFGWNEEIQKDKVIFNLSTAGWSGNESLIYSLERNKSYIWSTCWVQSRRGGHYIFEVNNNIL